MNQSLKNNTPLVSVLMTAYNRENFIVEAIESVLSSTYTNFELIIVDDGSIDRTVELAREYEKSDTRIKIYINEQNLGDYPNRNRAASYATGEYIMYVDSDDKLLPDTFNNIFRDVNDDPDFNFAMYWPHSNEIFKLSGNEALKKHFFEKQFLYIGPGGTFMRRSFFNSIGGYPEKYGPANDMYFNLKVCCHNSIHLLPYEFIFYRRHEGQEINNRFSYMYNNYNYLRDALDELPLPFTKQQINWSKKKNKRRFIVHLFNFFKKTRDIKKTSEAYKMANFSIRDVFEGIFH